MLLNAPRWFRWPGLLLTLVLAFGLAACQPSSDTSKALPIVQSMAWHMDTSGRATLEDVKTAKSWTSFEGQMSWGFGTEPIWIRYTLRAALPEEKEPWIVGVQPTYLDELTLYDPATPRTLRGGDTVTRTDDALGSLNYSFEIPALAQERTLYLRVDTQSSRLVITDVRPLREAQAKNNSSERLMAFLVSVAIVFALWSSMQWGLIRERVMGAYALKQWMATVWVFSVVGFSRVLLSDHVPPDIILQVDDFVRIWTIATTIWFFTVLFEDYGLQRGWLRATLAGVALVIVLPFLQFLDMTRFMLFSANVMVIVCLSSLWLALLFAQPSRQKQNLPYFFLWRIQVRTATRFNEA